MEAMSLETLLEAAKYVEYQTEAKARGEEPHDYHTFSKLCSASKDGQYSPVARVSVPKRQQTLSNSSQSSEEIKEKKRSGPPFLKDSGLSHEHSGTGTREVHNKLEKNRRAHLKECFEALKKQLPNMDDRKTSNLSILRGAIRFIQILKRKERDYEHDMERLAREKIAFQQRLSILKKDLSSQLDHIDVNSFIKEEDNETTTTASECGALSDFDDNGPNDASTLNSAGTSDFASSSSSSTASSSVLVGPVSAASSAAPMALSKPSVAGAHMTASGKDSAAATHQYVHESRLGVDNKASVLSSLASPCPAQMSHAEGSSAQTTRVFSTNNLHTMAGIFAAPHTMQVITQPSGLKVITTPNSIMASNSPVQHISVSPHPHGHIHVLTPSSSASYIASKPPFCPDPMAQGKRPHLVSPLALVSPQAMVELSQGNPNSLNLSQKGGSVLSAGNMAIAMKNSLVSTSNQSNMIATLHVSKPSHSQMIQPSLGASIITQGGSHINNGTHSGITGGLKPIVSNPVRSLPHITGIAHVVSQSPITTPVGQLVSPSNHVSAVTPLVGSVSVVSHTGTMHQQSLGKVLASPVLKSVNQLNPIPIIQQQFLQQVSVGSPNQPIVKPVVVVSMPNVVPNANMSPLTPTSLVSMTEQTGIVRGSVTQK